MNMKNARFYAFLFLLTFLPILNLFASWHGPTEVFSATWGKGVGQMGHETGSELDVADTFPISILVTDDKRIIIGDIVNDRVVIVKNGRFHKTFRPSALSANATMSWKMQWTTLSGHRFLLKLGAKYQIYDTDGILLKTFEGVSTYIEEIISLSDDSVVVHTSKPNSYYHYTSDGKLLNTFSSEPQEVTKLHEQRQTIIESINLPEAGGDTKVGKPVVAPNGDVYVWIKTPLRYSIKKWIRNAAEKSHK